MSDLPPYGGQKGLTVPASPTATSIPFFISATELGASNILVDSSDNITKVGSIDMTTTDTNRLSLPTKDDAANPSLEFPGSGIYEKSLGQLSIAISGSRIWFYSGNSLNANGVNGAGIINETASDSNPTLVPRRGKPASGVGSAVDDAVSLISDGSEVARFFKGASGQPAMHFPEITTPTAIDSFGSAYFKADNKYYAQTGDGVEHEVAFV